jgi:ATP-dependent Clp protease ATP-binding subunit ClpC
MFDRFTKDAKLSMNLARQEAQRLRSDFMSPEHILLGLLSVDGCAARSILGKLGIDLSEFRAEVERSLVFDPELSTLSRPQLMFTSEARRTLELSFEEATRLGHREIDTDHFLLGLIRCEDSIAAPALLKVGVTIEAARKLVIERRG